MRGIYPECIVAGKMENVDMCCGYGKVEMGASHACV